MTVKHGAETNSAGTRVVLDGVSLDVKTIEAIANGAVRVDVDAHAREQAERAVATVAEVVQHRPVYGRTTGVGANRTAAVSAESRDSHGLRLLRSHAAGSGDLLSPAETRALMAVRANQLLAGGAGVSLPLLDALVEALNTGALPAVHSLGAIGTGDLTALAETAITLLGERPWRSGGISPVPLAPGDGLAFMESNAATISVMALALARVERLLEGSLFVAALSFLALRGTMEAYAEEVHLGHPHPGNIATAERMRQLLGVPGHLQARIQDPYGLRCLPQVHGPAVDALADLHTTLRVEFNAAAENPLVSAAARDVFHHGGFHLGTLALAGDRLRLAVLQTGQLSVARLTSLGEPALTGLRPFLADAEEGSSGTLILEYTAASGLASLRSAAYPVLLGHAVLSRGVEEHASFASQGAWQLREAVEEYLTVLAAELVAAVRALRQRPHPLTGVSPELSGFLDLALQALPEAMEDRPLDGDIETAKKLLIGGEM